MTVTCEKCGAAYGIGQSPYCRDGHQPVGSYHPFIGYFDIALGAQVDSLAQRKRLMKAAGVDYRDKMSPGDLSARADRIADQKREARQ